MVRLASRRDRRTHEGPAPAALPIPLTTQEAVLSSKIEGTQAILGELLKFEAGEADNGIKSMTGPRLREAVIQAPVRL